MLSISGRISHTRTRAHPLTFPSSVNHYMLRFNDNNRKLTIIHRILPLCRTHIGHNSYIIIITTRIVHTRRMFFWTSKNSASQWRFCICSTVLCLCNTIIKRHSNICFWKPKMRRMHTFSPSSIFCSFSWVCVQCTHSYPYGVLPYCDELETALGQMCRTGRTLSICWDVQLRYIYFIWVLLCSLLIVSSSSIPHATVGIRDGENA